MKKLSIVALATILLLSSCSSTSSFVRGVTTDPTLPVSEKLIASGSTELNIPYPECYFDADLFLERYIELIESAKDYIFISTFLATYSDGLHELYEAIARKAEEGVRIYMIMDGFSSLDMTESRKYMTPLYFLRDYGVHLLEYNAPDFLHLIALQTFMIRDHRKLIVVDGRYAVLGGMNMNYISLGADNVDLQRDSMYVFDSAALSSALADEFVTLWNEASIEKINRSDFTVQSDEGKDLSLKGYIFNQGPGSDNHIADLFASLFSSAKEEIVILPYLPLLNDNMYTSLKEAIKRGVKVKMYIPIDTREYVQKGTLYDYWRLVDAGIEVYYEYTGGETEVPLLHQKLTVVDGRYSVIGSTNFNYRSMGLSYEIAMVIDSEKFAKDALAQVADISKNVSILDIESAKRMKKEKGNVFFYLFSFFGG